MATNPVQMNKFLPKNLKKQTAPPPETGGRITNETVAEHRERILAGGRRFKYPMQYTRHRVLAMTVFILLVAFISFFSFATWQLYNSQNVGSFMYRLTRIVPYPVARAEGELVRYSTYLRELRSSIHYFSTKEALTFDSDDGKRQLEYQKRLALDKAIENTLITKMAKQEGVSVGRQEVNDFVANQISRNRLGLTEQAYQQIIRSYYDWSLDEYKESIRAQILKKKLSAKIAKAERSNIESIWRSLKDGANFAEKASQLSEDLGTNSKGGDMGVVSIKDNDPSGIIEVASKQQPGQISEVIEGIDGFYIVQLAEKVNDEDLRMSKIFISYKELDIRLQNIKATGKIEEFIKVEPIAAPTT